MIRNFDLMQYFLLELDIKLNKVFNFISFYDDFNFQVISDKMLRIMIITDENRSIPIQNCFLAENFIC